MTDIEVDGLFETHLTVTDLNRAIRFYHEVVGLHVARIEPERQVAFFWIGLPGTAMLGLWSAGWAPQRMTSHAAFRVSLADVLAAPIALNRAGVTPLDSEGRPTAEPVVFAWMPAASVFFRDPDEHLLEYIAMLPDEAGSEHGVVPWNKWESIRRDRGTAWHRDSCAPLQQQTTLSTASGSSSPSMDVCRDASLGESKTVRRRHRRSPF